MSLSFEDLQNKVLGWLDEGTTDDADEGTLALVKEALNDNDSQRASSQRWPFMLIAAPVTFSLVPGQRNYTLATDVHIPLYFWNTSTKTPLIETGSEDVPSRDYASSGLIDDYLISNPAYGTYTLRGQTLVLNWEPVNADVIQYEYYKLPTEMSADADLPNIPYPHSRVLIWDALLDMANYNEDITPAKIKLWQKKQTEHEDNLLAAHDQTNGQFTAGTYLTYIPR